MLRFKKRMILISVYAALFIWAEQYKNPYLAYITVPGKYVFDFR
jgi:hypothetical protein